MAKLFLIGTPIGNLGDFSPRGVETLRQADFIAAEDTRVTRKLLARFSVSRPLVCYHRHNFQESGPKIVERILAGETCALVTDAGMPAISDPGEDLVRLCAAAGIEVAATPGPTAAMTALALSGLASGRFCFEGFLSARRSLRQEQLAALRQERRTMIFYEAPHRLCETLSDLAAAFGPDRSIAIGRELTKMHEEMIRCTLAQAVEHYALEPPRGEFVLVVEGCIEAPKALSIEEALAQAQKFLADGCSPSTAAKLAAAESGFRKGEIYRLLLRPKAEEM